MTRYWQQGDQIVLREIFRGRIWSGRPYTIVEDTPQRLIIYMGVGVRWMRPVRRNSSAIRGRELHWTLREAVWPIEALRIVTPGRHHSVLLLWTEGFGEFLKWYVNLEDPLTHSAVGFDYLDQFLEQASSEGPGGHHLLPQTDAGRPAGQVVGHIEIAPDLSAWNWKDEDELEDAVANGLMTPQRADLIRAEGIRVIETLDKKAPPFDEQWHLWRPDPQWESPGLPAGWDDLNENPARGGDDGP